MAVYRTAPTGGGIIVFYGWDNGTAAQTEFSGQGIPPNGRVMIAVAGVVAQHLAGQCGFIPPQPEPLQVFLPASGHIPEEVRGDYSTIRVYSAWIRPRVPIEDTIRTGVAEATSLLERLGGGPLIAQISLGVAVCLEEDNRARWRRAVEEHQSAVYNENLFYPALETIAAADSALAAGANMLREDIQAGRARRGVPPLP